jgi:PPP family 3-phenylpropionic acid transporter
MCGPTAQSVQWWASMTVDATDATTNPDLARLKRLYTWGGVATGAYIPFFVVYLSQRGVSAVAIGFTLAATSLLSAVIAPTWGHVADVRLGLAKALAVTLGASSVLMSLLYPHWPTSVLLCLLAVAYGSVFGTNPTISDALTLTVLGPERESAYGSVRLWTSLGWAVAVLLAGWVYQSQGLTLMVPFAVIGLLGMLWTSLGFGGDRHGPSNSESRSLADIPALLAKSRPLVLWLLALTLISVCTQAAVAFVPLAISDAGGGPMLLAISASVGAVFEIPLFARSEWIATRIGLPRMFLIGVLIQVLVIASWTVESSATSIAITKMATGFSYGLAYTATVVITSRFVPASMRAAGQGLMSVTSSLGPVIGAAIGGLVFEHIGSHGLFIGAAAGLLCAVALAAAVLGKAPSQVLDAEIPT